VQWTAGFRLSPIPSALAPPPLTRIVRHKMIPSVTVYVGEAAVIVAPLHATPEGILYEQDRPIVLSVDCGGDVGAAVKSAFAAFSTRAQDLRSAKKSDWPAFRASGCKSIKQFEAEFRRIHVEYLNASGAVARAELAIPGDEEFAVSTAFNPRLADEEVGNRVLGLVARCTRLTE
jgi:hypothetical protein